MATQKIRVLTNAQFNSTEIYFPEKPNAKVLEALKTVKYRWNFTKKCWYGFLSANEVKDVLMHPDKAQAMAETKAKERAEMWAKKKAEKKAENVVEIEVASETPKTTGRAKLTERGKALVSKSESKPQAKKSEPELNFDDVKKASKQYSAKSKK